MPVLQYRILHVFAESTFGGNPLAVVEDGSALSELDMQHVARQFNLSETTFIFPSNVAAARIRIFTPSYEMAFAGHPTLGSAHVVSELVGVGDNFSLETTAGVIPVRKQGQHWVLLAKTAKHRPMSASRAELASMLALPEAAIAGPTFWLDCGTEQPLIEVSSVAHLRACKPIATLLSQFSKNTDGQAKTYLFARTPEGFESRYFWMTDDAIVSEDPGTGSACANLGAWWLLAEGDKPLTARVRQGAAVNRPCLLTLKVARGQVEVGGNVIPIGKGELRW